MARICRTQGSYIGFGEDEEEIERDLYINKCKHDISLDERDLYKGRRNELLPWLPTKNVLHISNVGCLILDLNSVFNHEGKQVEIIESSNPFRYIAELFGTSVSYEDIIVVLRESIDELFEEEVYVNRLVDLPIIRLESLNLGFVVETLYQCDQGLLIAITKDAVGLKFVGDEYFHVVDMIEGDDVLSLIAYIGYKIGIVLSERGIEYVKEN